MEFEKRIPIEEIECPFIDDDSHQYLFDKVEDELTKATSIVRSTWTKYKHKGFGEFFEQAKRYQESKELAFNLGIDNIVSYELRHLGEGEDIFEQPIDIFEFTKHYEDQKNNFPQLIRISTYNGRYSQFSELIGFRVENYSTPILTQHFHLLHGELAAITQIAKPKVLFPNLDTPYRQFVDIGMAPEDQLFRKSLLIRAGEYHSVPIKPSTYHNTGGTLVQSHAIRIANILTGEVELLDKNDEGVLGSFRLYHAIENLAHMYPATE